MSRRTQQRRDRAAAQRAAARRSAQEAIGRRRKDRKDQRIAAAVSRVLDASSVNADDGWSVQRIAYAKLLAAERNRTPK